MKKAYYFLFYKIYSFFKFISDDGWSAWKSLIIVGGLNVFLILSVDIYFKIIFRKGFILELPKTAFIIIFAAISIIHYYYFLHDNSWEDYEKEYEKYSKKTRIIGTWAVFIFIIAVIVNLIFAFYQMSLVNWNKYH